MVILERRRAITPPACASPACQLLWTSCCKRRSPPAGVSSFDSRTPSRMDEVLKPQAAAVPSCAAAPNSAPHAAKSSLLERTMSLTFILPGRRVVATAARRTGDLRVRPIGISLASFENDMSEIGLPSTYHEPTVIWRMRHRDGRCAQAVIDPLTNGALAQWLVNDRALAVRYFAEWTGAIEWIDRLRDQQWAVGWRQSDDIPEERT